MLLEQYCGTIIEPGLPVPFPETSGVLKRRSSFNLRDKATVKKKNLFYNIAGKKLEKQCCEFYHPSSNLPYNKISLLQVA